MDRQTAEFYAQNAQRLSVEYKQIHPAYSDKLNAIFAGYQKILDVGCGTGRDFAYFLSKGKDIYGVDASRSMLAKANETLKQAGLDPGERLTEAILPNLDAFGDGTFDGVLCNAVLMHLPEDRLFDAVFSIKRVIRPGGILLFTIPESRPGINPKTNRDSKGRLYSDLPTAKLQLLFERVGFRLESSETVPDPMGREGYRWNRSVLKRLDEKGSQPLGLIESILNRDNKVATYKLALFRALAEIAQTQHHLAAYLPNDKIGIPLSSLAEMWLLYYWPIFNQSNGKIIRQGTYPRSGSDVAIRRPIYAIISHYNSTGGMEAFYVDWKSGKLNSKAKKLTSKALSKIRSIIWDKPIRHAGGGNFSVFQYDDASKTVLMDTSLWRELCLMGSWIQDATILRWAELSEQINKGAVSTSKMVECLLTVPNATRNVSDARRYFESLPEKVCVWTERPLKKAFAVDHALPFALWRNNDLWNLFPSAERVNKEKRDKIPTYELLHACRDRIIDYWKGLYSALDERFSRETQTLLGRDSFKNRNWEKPLFNRFVEAFEVTAHQRGASRWQPNSFRATKIKRTDPIPKRPPSTLAEERICGMANLTAVTSDTNFIRTPFHELGDGAYRTHLPLVASLAAGEAFHGFETSDLANIEELDWVAVSPDLIRPRRFVVHVAGDSMAPTLLRGQLAVFEYHRTPRHDGQIVIANLPEFGTATDGTEAIKRIRQTSTKWIFESDNPNYGPMSANKTEITHPILGCFVGRIESTPA